MPRGGRASTHAAKLAYDAEALKREHGVDDDGMDEIDRRKNKLRLAMPRYKEIPCDCSIDRVCDYCYNQNRKKAYYGAGKMRAAKIISAMERATVRYMADGKDIPTTDHYDINVYPLMDHAMLAGIDYLLSEGAIPFVLAVTASGSLIGVVLPQASVHVTWPYNPTVGDGVPNVAMLPLNEMNLGNFNRFLTQAELAGVPVRADLGLTIYTATVKIIGDDQPNAGISNARASAPGVWVYRPPGYMLNAFGRELLSSPTDNYVDDFFIYQDAVRLNIINERSAVRGEFIVERKPSDQKDILATAIDRARDDANYNGTVSAFVEQQEAHNRGAPSLPSDVPDAASSFFSPNASASSNDAALRGVVAQAVSDQDAAIVGGVSAPGSGPLDHVRKPEGLMQQNQRRRLRTAASDRELIILSEGETASSARMKASERRGAVDVEGKMRALDAACAMAFKLPVEVAHQTVKAGVHLHRENISNAVYNLRGQLEGFIQVLIDHIYPYSRNAASEQLSMLRNAISDGFLEAAGDMLLGGNQAATTVLRAGTEEDAGQMARSAWEDATDGSGTVLSCSNRDGSVAYGLDLTNIHRVDPVASLMHRIRRAHTMPISAKPMFKFDTSTSLSHRDIFAKVTDQYDEMTRTAWSSWAEQSSCGSCHRCPKCRDMRFSIHNTASNVALEFMKEDVVDWPASVRVKIDTHTTAGLDDLRDAFDAGVVLAREMAAAQRSAFLLPPMDWDSAEGKKMLADMLRQRALRTEPQTAMGDRGGGGGSEGGRATTASGEEKVQEKLDAATNSSASKSNKEEEKRLGDNKGKKSDKGNKRSKDSSGEGGESKRKKT